MNLWPKPPYQHLADELEDRLERQVRDERDEQTVEWTFQQMLENGQYSRIEKVCREWLARAERKDVIG